MDQERRHSLRRQCSHVCPGYHRALSPYHSPVQKPHVYTQHLGIDAFIVASGIMTGADLQGVIGMISALDGLQHFGKARFAIIVLQTMIADGFMVCAQRSTLPLPYADFVRTSDIVVLQVYRAFIVWSSSWCVISAPFAIFVSSVGASNSHEPQMYELLKVY